MPVQFYGEFRLGASLLERGIEEMYPEIKKIERMSNKLKFRKSI